MLEFGENFIRLGQPSKYMKSENIRKKTKNRIVMKSITAVCWAM